MKNVALGLGGILAVRPLFAPQTRKPFADVMLCWPTFCGAGFAMQCASNLTSQTEWQLVTNAVQVTNGLYCITLDRTQPNRFYRVAR
jgi:hypothetical protein